MLTSEIASIMYDDIRCKDSVEIPHLYFCITLPIREAAWMELPSIGNLSRRHQEEASQILCMLR